MVKIDVDRMKNGKRVGLGLRAGQDGGIPWFVYMEPDRSLLRLKPTEDGNEHTEDAVLQRRKDAVLATADGPDGNVGCPMSVAERAHFIGTLRTARIHMSDEELDTIAEALHALAVKTVGDRADS